MTRPPKPTNAKFPSQRAAAPIPRRTRPRRCTPLALGLLVITAVLWLLPSLATAAPTRNFYTELTGETPPSVAVPGPFSRPWGLAIGPADSIWVTDTDRAGVISAYDSLGGFLSQQTGLGQFTQNGEFIRNLSLSHSTGNLYVVEGATNELQIFDDTGDFIGEFTVGTPGNGEVGVALDNSGGPTQGRIYTDSNSDRRVRAFEPEATSVTEVHEFTASATYIEGNKITGTPAGPFAEANGIATDSQGNIYVGDGKVVDEFEPSGKFLRAFTTEEAPGSLFVSGLAVDPTNGNLLVGGNEAGAWVIDEFNSTGVYLGQIAGPAGGSFAELRGIALDSQGFLYVADTGNHVVDEFLPVGLSLPEATPEPATEVRRGSATLHATVDPKGAGNVVACNFEAIDDLHYSPWQDDPYAAGVSAPCLNDSGEVVGTEANPIGATTEVHADAALADLTTLNNGTTVHWRIAVANSNGVPRSVPGEDFPVPPAVSQLETNPVSELTQKSATLNGSFSGEAGIATSYHFEYGSSTNYAHKSPDTPVPPPASGVEAEHVFTPVEGLVAGVVYHYRVVAENEFGTTLGEDRTFTTYQPPSIEAFSSSDLTTTSAILHARINPQGLPSDVETECRFEYGLTVAYGTVAPCPETLSGTSGLSVAVEIRNLQPHVTYHFRVIAENIWGSDTSEDQSFEFFPPSCPNAAVRQQTSSSYLPDCRAYEIVSPGEANGTLFFPGGPNTGLATDPSRFSFTGLFSAVPGANPINTAADLYVATRTNGGWVSHYIGLPGNQAGCMGGPPTAATSAASLVNPPWLTNKVLADRSMGHLLNWLDGAGTPCGLGSNGTSDADAVVASPSNAPFLWSAEGTLERRLPSNLGELPGALEALACPYEGTSRNFGNCSGETTASGDLTHLLFSTRALAFAPGALTQAPGSAYDDDLATGTVRLISTLKDGGEPIPQDPLYAIFNPPHLVGQPRVPAGSEEFLRFPGVSTDGSHILISTATATTPECRVGVTINACQRFIDTPVRLYMSIDDEGAVEVSKSELSGKNIGVSYAGMTPDGSRVFFTSSERLTVEDIDTSADLYVWSQQGEEEGRPLTLISKGDNEGQPGEPGSSGECQPAMVNQVDERGHPVPGEVPWTRKCGVLPYSGYGYSWLLGGIGGNGVSDSAIAANGDIYFYSPEQLDGDRGVLDQQNLYVYRDGRVQFVAALHPERTCTVTGISSDEELCADGPVVRIDVSPDDSHMAFVTASRITPYDNAGHLEMYSYTPSSGRLVCDSCNPDGTPATADVRASEDGRFMTDDGRVFFSTDEALVARDTNEGTDVYEFTDGRPQLITTGTGAASGTHTKGGSLTASSQLPGLVGVSADGTDVYFSTFDSLVSEDQNGSFFKFYDARTNGGFLRPAPNLPCEAAEECHGPGTEAPSLPAEGTAAELGGGNVRRASRRKARKRHRKVRGRHHRKRSARAHGGKR
jgi:hypothetical protein